MADYAYWMKESGLPASVVSGNIHHDYSRLPGNTPHPLSDIIERFPIWGTALARKAIYLPSPRYFLRVLRLVLLSSAPVYIHLFDFRGLAPIAAMALKMLFPKKIIYVHSAFGTLHPKPSRIRALYDRLILTRQIRALDIGLVQNAHEKEVYEALIKTCGGEARTALVPLHTDDTVNCEWDSIHSKAKQLRIEHGISDSAVVLLFLGRFHPEKGLLRALDLLVSLRGRGIDAVMFLVGRDHGFQKQMEAHIREHRLSQHVRVVTNVSSERFSYYALASVFIGVPTIYEETMLSAVEALSCGAPVLLSREADMPFVDGCAGYVIDFDLNLAVNKVLAILNGGETFRKNARLVVEHHYSPTAARSQFFAALGRPA